jgi:hypothetical protein
MENMEAQFTCSGWCQVNRNAYYMFTGADNKVEPIGPCFNEWANWVESEWKSIIGCVSTMVVILFLNIVSVNWRILAICNKDE